MWQLNLPDLEIDWKKLTDVLTYDPQQPMIFSSGLFLWLFLGFSLIYLLLQRKTTARLLFVSLFSYYFYYKSSGFYFSCWASLRCPIFCWPVGCTGRKPPGSAN